MKLLGTASLALLAAASGYAGARSVEEAPARPATVSTAGVPLKEAKLNIEHNATDRDTGFQGAIDSEGWRNLDVRGPRGKVLTLQGARRARQARADRAVLRDRRAREQGHARSRRCCGSCRRGSTGSPVRPRRTASASAGRRGTAWLTHDIPAGPRLVSPAEGATVPTRGVVADWEPVSKTITGKPVRIIAYQLIIEKDVEPHRHMIGKFGLSMYLPRSVTRIDVPDGFLEPGTAYNWEVLAIERSGNQTLSSGSFKTG